MSPPAEEKSQEESPPALAYDREADPAIDPDNEFIRESEGDMESLVGTARRELQSTTAKKEEDKPVSETANISEHSIEQADPP